MTLTAHGVTLDAEVGRRVHLMMWDRHLTQTKLGRQVGIDQSALGKKIRGERSWSLDEVRAVAEALETTIAFLVGEDGNPSDDAWARWGSNPRPADYTGVGSQGNRITFAHFPQADRRAA